MKQVKNNAGAHEDFKAGQGYGSSEKNSDYQTQHRSLKQYGDNPLPKSGGNWKKAGSYQPKQERTEEIHVAKTKRSKERRGGKPYPL